MARHVAIQIIPLFYSIMVATAYAGSPLEYTITDIASWNDAQLQALPYFKRFTPVRPSGTVTNFARISRNGEGVVAGNINASNPRAAPVQNSLQTLIAP